MTNDYTISPVHEAAIRDSFGRLAWVRRMIQGVQGPAVEEKCAEAFGLAHQQGTQFFFINPRPFHPLVDATALRQNVDLIAARESGLTVVRIPAYSPYAVAEHTVGLILTLNRKMHRAYARVREGNFALDGLLGFDLHGRTVGIIGTGKIGAVVIRYSIPSLFRNASLTFAPLK